MDSCNSLQLEAADAVIIMKRGGTDVMYLVLVELTFDKSQHQTRFSSSHVPEKYLWQELCIFINQELSS